MLRRFERWMLVRMVSRWRRDNGDLRFGQWIWFICGGDPFMVEDDKMAKLIMEKFKLR